MKRHLIIDANNLLYRAFYISSGEGRDKKGNPVGGIFHCLRMFNLLIIKYKPTNIIICWDEGKSKERLKIYPEYKQQREKNRKGTESIPSPSVVSTFR